MLLRNYSWKFNHTSLAKRRSGNTDHCWQLKETWIKTAVFTNIRGFCAFLWIKFCFKVENSKKIWFTIEKWKLQTISVFLFHLTVFRMISWKNFLEFWMMENLGSLKVRQERVNPWAWSVALWPGWNITKRKDWKIWRNRWNS